MLSLRDKMWFLIQYGDMYVEVSGAYTGCIRCCLLVGIEGDISINSIDVRLAGYIPDVLPIKITKEEMAQIREGFIDGMPKHIISLAKYASVFLGTNYMERMEEATASDMIKESGSLSYRRFILPPIDKLFDVGSGEEHSLYAYMVKDLVICIEPRIDLIGWLNRQEHTDDDAAKAMTILYNIWVKWFKRSIIFTRWLKDNYGIVVEELQSIQLTKKIIGVEFNMYAQVIYCPDLCEYYYIFDEYLPGYVYRSDDKIPAIYQNEDIVSGMYVFSKDDVPILYKDDVRIRGNDEHKYISLPNLRIEVGERIFENFSVI